MADSAVVTSPAFSTSATFESAVASSGAFATSALAGTYNSQVASSAAFLTGALVTIASATSPVAPGDTVTVQGTNLDTVTAVTVDGEAQVIDTQAAGELTFTLALGGLAYGARTLAVTNGATTATIALTLEPVAGRGFVEVAGYPPPNGQISVLDGAQPPAEDGDQIEYDLLTDRAGDVTMYVDGTFEIGGTGTHNFDVRVWDATDSSWGAWTQVTVAEGTLFSPEDVYLGLDLEEVTLTVTASAVSVTIEDVDLGLALDSVALTQISEAVPVTIEDVTLALAVDDPVTLTDITSTVVPASVEDIALALTVDGPVTLTDVTAAEIPLQTDKLSLQVLIDVPVLTVISVVTYRLTAEIVDQNHDPVEDAIFMARLTKPDTDAETNMVVPTTTWARADANGVAQLRLWPNTVGRNNSRYRIIARHPRSGIHLIDRTIVMPEADVNLASLVDYAGAGSIAMPPLNNYGAEVDPGPNDDLSKGYQPGSDWFNRTNRKLWRCVSAAQGNARWADLGEAP